MSGFIITPPAPISSEISTVAADGWFPAVDVTAIRTAIRIGEGIVTHERLVAAIEGAMLTAFRALGTWRSKMALAGHEDLASVDPRILNEKPIAVLIWERIIRYYAAAEIADLHRDISATDQGTIRADHERQSADEYRRMAHNAITDLLSLGGGEIVARNRVSLI